MLVSAPTLFLLMGHSSDPHHFSAWILRFSLLGAALALTCFALSIVSFAVRIRWPAMAAIAVGVAATLVVADEWLVTKWTVLTVAYWTYAAAEAVVVLGACFLALGTRNHEALSGRATSPRSP